MNRSISTDIVVVGGGSGGFGAAIRLAADNPAAQLIVIDSMDRLGGTSTIGGVNNWEPGIAGFGAHRELFAKLLRRKAIGVASTVQFASKEKPYALSRIEANVSYESTLRRSGLAAPQWRRVQFEPQAMAHEMEQMLYRSGRATICYRTKCIAVHSEGRAIRSITVQPLDEPHAPYDITARYFIDCSGGIHLARLAGCTAAFGEEGNALYGEPSAPSESHPSTVNGVTQVYRVSRSQPLSSSDPEPASAPAVAAAREWVERRRPSTFITEYPNGDLCMNVLPIMEGSQFFALPPEEAQNQCRLRAKVHWQWFRRHMGFDTYHFHSLFPLVGVRESHRLLGRFVLREQDIRAGLLQQEHGDEFIAFADHPLDIHGPSNVKHSAAERELLQPYGIPYGCLLPREYDNLIVASRGASFSHIAASSCRLSRTMMDLGEAAGAATALALEHGCTYPEVPLKQLQHKLRIAELTTHIVKEWGLYR